MSTQILTLHLDGITAGDYLAWVRDPEPRTLGPRVLDIAADPRGDTITAVLSWDGSVPTPSGAAAAAGLPVTADVRLVLGALCQEPCVYEEQARLAA